MLCICQGQEASKPAIMLGWRAGGLVMWMGPVPCHELVFVLYRDFRLGTVKGQEPNVLHPGILKTRALQQGCLWNAQNSRLVLGPRLEVMASFRACWMTTKWASIPESPSCLG